MVFFLIMYSQYLYEKVTKLTCNLMVLKYACNYKDQIKLPNCIFYIKDLFQFLPYVEFK